MVECQQTEVQMLLRTCTIIPYVVLEHEILISFLSQYVFNAAVLLKFIEARKFKESSQLKRMKIMKMKWQPNGGIMEQTHLVLVHFTELGRAVVLEESCECF